MAFYGTYCFYFTEAAKLVEKVKKRVLKAKETATRVNIGFKTIQRKEGSPSITPPSNISTWAVLQSSSTSTPQVPSSLVTPPTTSTPSGRPNRQCTSTSPSQDLDLSLGLFDSSSDSD